MTAKLGLQLNLIYKSIFSTGGNSNNKKLTQIQNERKMVILLCILRRKIAFANSEYTKKSDENKKAKYFSISCSASLSVK